MNKYIQVVTTIDNKQVAETIASSIIEMRLAACVQISNCQSMYRWQGKVEKADEFVCVMKSRSDLFPALKEAIKNIHTYDVPEIIATEIIDGGSDYLGWIEQELRPSTNN